MEKRLLTIQDISCVGKCSTTVVLPLISACGIECAVLPSSVLSNHTASGYSSWTFRDLTEDMISVMNQWLKEKIPVSFHGTGDVFASVVAGALMTGKTLIEASTIAADIVVESIKATIGDDSHWYGVKFEKAIPALVRKIYSTNCFS